MGKNAGDNIPESADAGQSGRPPSPVVTLTYSGRHFFCPHCKRHHPHPPADPEFYMIGYAFCEFSCDWMPISGGDACGVVHFDERGRAYTVERGTRRVPKP